jgi:hypothetical protein
MTRNSAISARRGNSGTGETQPLLLEGSRLYQFNVIATGTSFIPIYCYYLVFASQCCIHLSVSLGLVSSTKARSGTKMPTFYSRLHTRHTRRYTMTRRPLLGAGKSHTRSLPLPSSMTCAYLIRSTDRCDERARSIPCCIPDLWPRGSSPTFAVVEGVFLSPVSFFI